MPAGGSITVMTTMTAVASLMQGLRQTTTALLLKSSSGCRELSRRISSLTPGRDRRGLASPSHRLKL